MPAKVQSHGINKNVLIKLHQDILEDILERGYNISDEKMVDFTEFARLYSSVLLFGVDELATSDFKYKNSIVQGFDPSYGGLNTFVEKESKTRNYEHFSNWVLEKLKLAENFFIRALADIPNSEVEDKFIGVIESLETFLQAEYAKTLLPLLIKIENEIKSELEALYNNNALSEDEAKAQAFEYLDKKQKESVDLFLGTIQEKLNDEAIKQAILAIGILGLVGLSDTDISKQRKTFEYGYLSNVEAYFFNEIRKIKEKVFDNISQNKRSLATDQLQDLYLNKNIFKLSVVSHPRALFRSLVAKSAETKTEYFKAIVPSSVLPTLNPKGVTASNLYLIKTKEEWAKTNGVENINVVDGLGLHHGSQEYYLPILDFDKENTLAKEQRRIFLESLEV
jgi:hypothetical protein